MSRLREGEYPMSNAEQEARCKSCGRPVVQRPGRRKREFCNASCRQRHHRKHQRPQSSVDAEQTTPPSLQEQLAALQEENAVLRTTTQTLVNFLEKLRDVKETARTDTQARPFKAWLRQARSYAQTPFGQRFLEKSVAMSPRGSRGRYQEEMRRAGFPPEEKELFQEAWEAMLWYELFRVEYVTIRDTVERAIPTLRSVGGYS
jgi:hypothetical protein